MMSFEYRAKNRDSYEQKFTDTCNMWKTCVGIDPIQQWKIVLQKLDGLNLSRWANNILRKLKINEKDFWS